MSASRLALAERNLRSLIRFGAPHKVSAYGQDIVDVIGELDVLRMKLMQVEAAATAALEGPASATALRATASRLAGRG